MKQRVMKVAKWRGKEYKVPSLTTLERWDNDGYCKTPDGRRVEPDHPESWMSLLGLI